MRSWVITFVLMGLVVGAVALASAVFSDDGDTSAETPADETAQARPEPRRADAALQFAQTKHSRGATGVVAVERGDSRLTLVIQVRVPGYRTYGISLWSSKRKWIGLYAGYRGQNTQIMRIRPARLLEKDYLVVGRQYVRPRGPFRPPAVSHRLILKLSTGKILNRLLLAAKQ